MKAELVQSWLMRVNNRNDNKKRGIIMMLCAVLFFSIMDASMKVLAAHYPAIQVTALRALSSLPLICAYVLWRRAVPSLFKIRWPYHVFRMGLGITMLTCFAFALKTLPLAEAYALFFIAPLLIAALSIPFLGEHVPAANWWAIMVGLLGVLVVLKPSGQGMVSIAGLAILASAICYALSAITVRLLSRTDSSESMVFWLMLGVALGAGVMAHSVWQPVLPSDYGALLILAVSGFIGQLCITEAFTWAPAATVTPFEYAALALGLGFDFLLWHSWPSWRVLLGALIIVASGIYLARHETQALEAEHP